ncbi:hypothetical protein I5Q34_33650 [Streptomyces sp. AV19]|uniref:hypothetical protein n=1 Tax=Streptomyces sp. AV19 TaxID=2793068 RepID=UPI0018FE7181|nr:hypothetical protein [Streptomyces sp. AV19]MBH1939148.1 hypothetical protein [Streptomyces sp. AV19]MDG4535286.1 hypothetical protein [Streptomyces sp. AV19]
MTTPEPTTTTLATITARIVNAGGVIDVEGDVSGCSRAAAACFLRQLADQWDIETPQP